MLQRNWVDLSRKLVDRWDLLYDVTSTQVAIGEQALACFGEGVLPTREYPSPFPVTLSGAVLGGNLGNGIGFNPNGQITRVDTGTPAFTILPNGSGNPRKDLLVLTYKQTGDTPIPKPSDPILTVFLNLHDDYTLSVIEGTPAGSPVYPAKGSLDIIIGGILVPSAAAIGTDCTLDLTVREIAYIAGITAAGVSASNSGHFILTGTNVQTQLDETDAYLHALVASGVPASNAGHTYLTGTTTQAQLDETDSAIISIEAFLNAGGSPNQVLKHGGVWDYVQTAMIAAGAVGFPQRSVRNPTNAGGVHGAIATANFSTSYAAVGINFIGAGANALVDVTSGPIEVHISPYSGLAAGSTGNSYFNPHGGTPGPAWVTVVNQTTGAVLGTFEVQPGSVFPPSMTFTDTSPLIGNNNYEVWADKGSNAFLDCVARIVAYEL